MRVAVEEAGYEVAAMTINHFALACFASIRTLNRDDAIACDSHGH